MASVTLDLAGAAAAPALDIDRKRVSPPLAFNEVAGGALQFGANPIAPPLTLSGLPSIDSLVGVDTPQVPWKALAYVGGGLVGLSAIVGSGYYVLDRMRAPLACDASDIANRIGAKFSEALDDDTRSFFTGLQKTIANPQELAFDKNSKFRSCRGELKIALPDNYKKFAGDVAAGDASVKAALTIGALEALVEAQVKKGDIPNTEEEVEGQEQTLLRPTYYYFGVPKQQQAQDTRQAADAYSGLSPLVREQLVLLSLKHGQNAVLVAQNILARDLQSIGTLGGDGALAIPIAYTSRYVPDAPDDKQQVDAMPQESNALHRVVALHRLYGEWEASKAKIPVSQPVPEQPAPAAAPVEPTPEAAKPSVPAPSVPAPAAAPAAPAPSVATPAKPAPPPAPAPQAAARPVPVPQPAQRPAVAARPAPAATDAVVAGMISDAESCMAKKKYDCAIANARSALRVAPTNSTAKALLQRAEAAQKQALDSITIN